MARKKVLGQKQRANRSSLLAGDIAEFSETLVQTGKNQALDAKSPLFWKAEAIPDYKFNMQIPSSPAILLKSHNPPPAWRGPDFMDFMTSIYQNTSQNSLRYPGKPE